MSAVTNKHQAFAKQLVDLAMKRGASQAEAFVQVGRTADVRVRDGEIEDLTQATSKGAGLRVIVDGRLGFCWTSDFGDAGLSGFVDLGLQLARAAAPNEHNGLPRPEDLGAFPDVGPLFDREVAELRADWKIEASLAMEKVVKAFDPRLKTVDSVGAGESVGEVYLANSRGTQGGYDGTYVYLYASPVASDGEQLQTSSWVDYRRFFKELDSPEAVATEAARRTVRMLGAKKVKSCRVPVVFEPMMTASFIGSLAGACNGDAVHKKASFLAGKLGQAIAPKHFTLVDDGRLAKGLGTAPFDGEGVPTRTTKLIDAGSLGAYLYDVFTARKAGARTTGNAARGYRSTPSIGTHNLYLEPGREPPQALLKGISQGLYVTAMLGHGANTVTGEYSRGANGLWIENGELTHPVQEVTVAGNLVDMLQRVDAIANDLTFRGSTGAPTIRFSELTVSGE